MKKHSDILFSLLIILSVIILAPFVLRNDIFVQSASASPPVSSPESEPMESAPIESEPSESEPSESDLLESDPQESVPQESIPQESTPPSQPSPEASAPETAASDESSPAADSGQIPSLEEFFSDALFIGDSRTVGLMEYAGLDTANFFATSGMSSFQVLSEEVSVPGVGKMTLSTLFEQKSYGKIFLMLGINELGYEFSSVVKQYGRVVDFIRQAQPQATLYVCANLHLTKSRSDSDDIYNNGNIDRLNAEIAALADNESIFYLDVNPLFDDENGALNAQYSADDTHPYGKYYAQWGQWIYDACVQEKPSQ